MEYILFVTYSFERQGKACKYKLGADKALRSIFVGKFFTVDSISVIITAS